jgi:membrane protein DedA with SNARE-associated domain
MLTLRQVDMLNSLARHSFVAVLLAVMVEELGIPMPIPTDIMIVFVGANRPASQLALLFVLLTVSSAVGASGLYAIIRRGGRPLVDRFGRYVHLGPEQLARSEALLARGGWGGIALGRAIPGLRYATVVACGLFKVPYPRFVTAHLAGSSVYIVIFLALGALFGPRILDRIHPPALVIRLLWLLPLAVGLPLLMAWWGTRTQSRRPTETPHRQISAVLLGAFAGTTALAATWSVTATVAELLGASRPLNVPYLLLNLNPDVGGNSLLLHAALLSLFVGIAVAYYEFILLYLAPRRFSLPRQVLGLSLLALGVLSVLFVATLLVTRYEAVALWWQARGPIALLGIVVGIGVYGATTVYGHAVATDTSPAPHRERHNSTQP